MAVKDMFILLFFRSTGNASPCVIRDRLPVSLPETENSLMLFHFPALCLLFPICEKTKAFEGLPRASLRYTITPVTVVRLS